MKKCIFLPIFLSLIFCLTVFGQNGNNKNDKNPNASNNNRGGNDEIFHYQEDYGYDDKEQKLFHHKKGTRNLVPPWGYVGLGTLHPSEKLEVIGNVKVSQSIFAHDLDVIGLSTTAFTVREDATIGRNLFVQGNVGVGIQNPVEKLEIDGNLKVTQGIFSQTMTTENFSGTTGLFSGNLGVQQNFTVDGLTGLGVANPTERLEVAGNIKATEGIYSESITTNSFSGNTGTFSGNLTVNENFFLDGLLGIGTTAPSEKIDVVGNVKTSGNFISTGLQTGTGDFTSNVNIGQDLVTSGNIGIGVTSPTEKLDVLGNIKASGDILSETLQTTTFTGIDGSYSNNLTIGQNLVTNGNIGIGIGDPTEKLEILGNVKASGSISAQSLEIQDFNSANGSFTGSLNVGQNFTVSGLTGLGVANPTEKLDVSGNIKASGNISAQAIQIDNFNSTNGSFTGNLTVDQNLSVNGLTGLGVAAPTEKLEVAGNIKATGLLTNEIKAFDGHFQGNITLDQGLHVSGTSDFSGPVMIGNLTIQNNLDLQNDLIVGNSLGVNVASPQATLHIGGDGVFDGNITAVKLIVQDLEVANLDLGNQNGDKVSFDQDLYVEGNVGIGTEKVQGYKLSVNGKIRASDDIKVYPSVEWADYVFDKDYQLASLEEVESYIEANHRLPKMPSSENVKNSGIDLGAMDAKLLEKIEELTIYMIQLKKENEKLKNEVDRLKSKIGE